MPLPAPRYPRQDGQVTGLERQPGIAVEDPHGQVAEAAGGLAELVRGRVTGKRQDKFRAGMCAQICRAASRNTPPSRLISLRRLPGSSAISSPSSRPQPAAGGGAVGLGNFIRDRMADAGYRHAMFSVIVRLEWKQRQDVIDGAADLVDAVSAATPTRSG